jgi:hypothetical protein
MYKLLLAVSLCLGAHTLIWFQLNGQFMWPWFKRNPTILAIGLGAFISYMFIFSTRYFYEYFDGLLWPGRFIGFSLGMINYAVLTGWLIQEGINLKTLTSLILATGIVCVQLFWK